MEQQTRGRLERALEDEERHKQILILDNRLKLLCKAKRVSHKVKLSS